MRVSEAIRIRELAQAVLTDEQLATLESEMEALSRLGMRTTPGSLSLSSEDPSDGVLGTAMEAHARAVMSQVREVQVDS